MDVRWEHGFQFAPAVGLERLGDGIGVCDSACII
jgi:hypothetical protein